MRRTLGLDISAAEARWVELDEDRGRYSVRASGTAALPDASGSAKLEALRELAARHRWRGREVVVALPRNAVALYGLTLPAASREDTAGMLELEGLSSLPFPAEDAAWDFLSRPQSETRQEVLLVAARREMVEQQRRLLEAAGLRVGAVTLDVLAVTSLYRTAVPAAEERALIVHRNGASAALCYVQGDRLLLSRSVRLEYPADAEALATEVQRTLVAAAMASGAASGSPTAVSHIWLTGDGADPAFARSLAVALGPKSEEAVASVPPLNPPAGPVPVSPLPREGVAHEESLPPSFDLAIGLALMGLRPDAARLDLARRQRGAAAPTARSAPESSGSRLPLLAGLGGAAAVVALFLLLGSPMAGDPALASAAARAQTEARQLAARRGELETRVRLLSAAVRPDHSYLDVLNDVSALTGGEAWLTQFTYDRGRPIVIRGAARSNIAVARLLEGLRRSAHLERVALGAATLTEVEGQSIVQFTITGQLRGDARVEPRRSVRTRTTRGGA